MHIAARTDPVAAVRADAPPEGGRSLPIRLCRFLVEAWLRHLERHMEYAVRRLHYDFRDASRG
jgi:hypothetical protein